jgi:hypothetical protein
MEHPDPARKLSANMYDIHHCCVYNEKTPDDEQRNCPKHVDFHSKNKFEKLLHLRNFILRKIIFSPPSIPHFVTTFLAPKVNGFSIQNRLTCSQNYANT